METVKAPYGLQRVSTYDELVEYLRRDNGEFLVHAPDRTATIIEMMSPYLSAWKSTQQAMIAKRQAELSFYSDPKQGDAPYMVREPHGHGGVGDDVNSMMDGHDNRLAQQRLADWQMHDGNLRDGLARADDRYQAMGGMHSVHDPHQQIAQHEGLDDSTPIINPPAPPPETPPSSLHDNIVAGSRTGAIGGMLSRAAMLGRDMAGTAIQGMRVGPVVSGGPIGSLIGRQYGSLSFLENAAANVAEVGAEGGAATALAAAGEAAEMIGLAGVTAGSLPLVGAVGGALGVAAIGGAIAGGSMGGIHWVEDEVSHAARNMQAFFHHQAGFDARPHPMDYTSLNMGVAAQPDRMIAPDHSAQSSTYDNLRNMAVPQTGPRIPRFPGGSGPPDAPALPVLPPMPRNRNGIGR